MLSQDLRAREAKKVSALKMEKEALASQLRQQEEAAKGVQEEKKKLQVCAGWYKHAGLLDVLSHGA